jgi:hypothetical protein
MKDNKSYGYEKCGCLVQNVTYIMIKIFVRELRYGS